jgi:hypothetical protein
VYSDSTGLDFKSNLRVGNYAVTITRQKAVIRVLSSEIAMVFLRHSSPLCLQSNKTNKQSINTICTVNNINTCMFPLH